jgi:hypothetical protein
VLLARRNVHALPYCKAKQLTVTKAPQAARAEAQEGERGCYETLTTQRASRITSGCVVSLARRARSSLAWFS